MQRKSGYVILGILILFLTGCAGIKSSPKVTIEPYTLSDQEDLLINKTGVDAIDYFSLTGTLEDDYDLQFFVEEYENGEFKQELLSTFDEVENTFKKELISFGINTIQEEDSVFLNVLAGTPSSLLSTNYVNQMSTSSTGALINEKITLEVNKPIYLSGWVGTNANSLRSIGNEVNGEFPVGLEEAEKALLFKVILTDEKRVVTNNK